MNKKAVLNIALLLYVNIIYAQGLRISGIVINSETGEPIENANIVWGNTNKGTITNRLGEFAAETDAEMLNLSISCIGFKMCMIVIRKSTADTIIKLNPVNYLMREVRVFSESGISSEFKMTLRNERIKQFAGISKDAMRSVELLQGVSSNNEATSMVNVRGGSPDENLVLINGVEVHNPFHIKEYSMASVSIFNIDMVRKIDFSAGGFSAEYGGGMSSMLNVEYDSGYFKKLSGKLDLSTVNANFLISGPVTKRGSFILCYRKSFVNKMLGLLTAIKNLPYITYYDVQGQYVYNFNTLHKIIMNVIYSKDNFKDYPRNDTRKSPVREKVLNKPVNTFVTETENCYSDYKYDNVLFLLKSKNIFSGNLFSETAISFYGEYDSEKKNILIKSITEYAGFPRMFRNSNEINNLTRTLRTVYATFLSKFMYYLNGYYTIKLGTELRRTFYKENLLKDGLAEINTNTISYPDTIIIKPSPVPDLSYSFFKKTSVFNAYGYWENIILLFGGLSVNAGCRFNYTDINRSLCFSPRFSFSAYISSNLIVKGAWGYYFQTPSYSQLRSITASDTNTGNQKAEHFILSFEKKLSDNFSVKADLYYKLYSHLIPASRQSDGAVVYANTRNDGFGFAKGIDLQLTLDQDPIYFRLNYGYLTAKEKAVNGKSFYPRFTDQTHTVSAHFNLNFKYGWEIGLSYFFGSGYAFTPFRKIYSAKEFLYKWEKGDKNSSHFPAYERADLSISRRFNLFNRPLKVYLDIMNVFNKRNVYAFWYKYNSTTGEPEIEAQKLLPVIPALGIIYELN